MFATMSAELAVGFGTKLSKQLTPEKIGDAFKKMKHSFKKASSLIPDLKKSKHKKGKQVVASDQILLSKFTTIYENIKNISPLFGYEMEPIEYDDLALMGEQLENAMEAIRQAGLHTNVDKLITLVGNHVTPSHSVNAVAEQTELAVMWAGITKDRYDYIINAIKNENMDMPAIITASDELSRNAVNETRRAIKKFIQVFLNGVDSIPDGFELVPSSINTVAQFTYSEAARVRVMATQSFCVPETWGSVWDGVINHGMAEFMMTSTAELNLSSASQWITVSDPATPTVLQNFSGTFITHDSARNNLKTILTRTNVSTFTLNYAIEARYNVFVNAIGGGAFVGIPDTEVYVVVLQNRTPIVGSKFSTLMKVCQVVKARWSNFDKPTLFGIKANINCIVDPNLGLSIMIVCKRGLDNVVLENDFTYANCNFVARPQKYLRDDNTLSYYKLKTDATVAVDTLVTSFINNGTLMNYGEWADIEFEVPLYKIFGKIIPDPPNAYNYGTVYQLSCIKNIREYERIWFYFIGKVLQGDDRFRFFKVMGIDAFITVLNVTRPSENLVKELFIKMQSCLSTLDSYITQETF